MADGTDQEARIFAVDTRFQKLARRPGGVSRQDAIKSAQGKLQEAEPSFDGWVEAELQQLAQAAQRIYDGGGGADAIENAAFHSYQLRNIGTTMQCELITFVAGCLCDVLDSVAAGARCDAESIRCHVDALQLAGQKKYRHLKPEQVPELTAGLRRIGQQIAAKPTAP